MVTKIKSGKSLKGALYYNERKVDKGLAWLLDAPGFQKDVPQLSIADKLSRLTDLAERNQRVRTNTLHISLNFDISEKLDATLLCDIAGDYMKGIGFKEQPYLVYQHLDAGHPHIHILTTNINTAGSRISLHNLGKLQSESARKAIEIKYGIKKAGDQEPHIAEKIRPEPIAYGKHPSKKTISNLVYELSRTYRYTSLIEFNAILSRFNLVADRGNTTSVMYSKNGLRYWMTDFDGVRLGVPFKASQLYGKPTLPFLQKQFQLNQTLRKPCREILSHKVEKAVRQSISLSDLETNLKKAGVELIKRVNPDGRIYGLTYLDHEHRVIFNGSDLGKSYSAGPVISAIQYRAKSVIPDAPVYRLRSDAVMAEVGPFMPAKSLVGVLLEPSFDGQVPAELLGKRRKKRKRVQL